MKPRLLDDVTRCYDDTCRERETCLRWIERNGGDKWTPKTQSLRVKTTKQCYAKIEKA